MDACIHVPMWCTVAWRGVTCCDVLWCDVMCCYVSWCDVMRCGAWMCVCMWACMYVCACDVCNACVYVCMFLSCVQWRATHVFNRRNAVHAWMYICRACGHVRYACHVCNAHRCPMQCVARNVVTCRCPDYRNHWIWWQFIFNMDCGRVNRIKNNANLIQHGLNTSIQNLS